MLAKPQIALPPGPIEVVLRHPTEGRPVGWWSFTGGRNLEVDFLAEDAAAMCRVDGTAGTRAELEAGFIPWPRLTFEVNGRAVEVVSREAAVLRRHYTRPQHQEVSYTPGKPDPMLEAFHQGRIAQARRLLRGVSGRVLDVGSGYSLVTMAGPWTFALFACDRDPGAVRHLVSSGQARAAIASAEEVPYRPGSFDAVYAGEIIEHLVEPEVALRGWVQLLRPGGRLVLTTPNRRHLLARITGHEQVVNPEHLFEYSRAELCAAVEAAGARVRHMEGLTLPLPVYLPGRGWRDLVPGLRRRYVVPTPVLRAAVRAGHWLPGLAENLALVAIRP